MTEKPTMTGNRYLNRLFKAAYDLLEGQFEIIGWSVEWSGVQYLPMADCEIYLADGRIFTVQVIQPRGDFDFQVQRLKTVIYKELVKSEVKE